MSDEEVEADPGVLDVLSALYVRDGQLTAESVVEEARNPVSRLHRHFEWNDADAAGEWRLHQARRLIGSYSITLMEQPVRAFVHVPSSGSYTPVRDAMTRPDWRKELLDKFEADARAFEARWSTHKWVAEEYVKWLKRQARQRAA